MKRFLAVFLAFALTVSVSAATYYGTIEATYGIKVFVDGQRQYFTDVNGTTVDPFVYNGTTYVPIRGVAEALNCDVSYDATTNTAYIESRRADNTQPTTQEPPLATIDTSNYYGSYKFPFHLYSNDGEYKYLGKLVTDEYASDGVWNKFSDYGSQYNRNSIWNEYGDYGSKYNTHSAFNEYARNPPIIVDDNGKEFGYLTSNEYKTNGYTILELLAFLKDNGQ